VTDLVLNPDAHAGYGAPVLWLVVQGWIKKRSGRLERNP
jgi:hypothetical protein